MSSLYSSIPEYIRQLPSSQQKKATELYRLMQRFVPKEAIETINYKMPTFRLRGNIIHFAFFKNHIGIYPGEEAMSYFASEMKEYKTSKGALQLPFSEPLPEALLRQLVHFNVKRLQDKQGPNWEKSYEKWSAAETAMTELLATLPLQKTFKWGSDVYVYEGKNVVAWRGFKDFFSVWFYQGVFLKDSGSYLIAASEGKTKALRQWRFTAAHELDFKKLKAYILESIETIKEGKQLIPQKFVELPLEGELLHALNENLQLKKAFEALTPGRRNEYIQFIDQAKQLSTKERRIQKIIPQILQKKGLHDAYKKSH